MEEDAVPGYEDAYEVKRSPESGYTDKAATYTLTNTTLSTMDVTVQKQWLGGDGQALKVRLKGSCGTETREESLWLTQTMNWTWTWQDLPRYSIVDGTVTEWTWTLEEDTPEGWEQKNLQMKDEVTAGGLLHRTYVLTNTKTGTDTVTISGTKTWLRPVNVPDAWLPDVTITLQVKKNGTPVDSLKQTQTLKSGTYSFENVPVIDADGTAYTYEITEEMPESYGNNMVATQVSAKANSTGGVDFVNSWNQNVTLTKAWDDFNNKNNLRPSSVTVHVIGKNQLDDVIVEKDVELTAANGWIAYLPRYSYDEEGKAVAISYQFEEDDVPDYTMNPDEDITSASGNYTITNHLINKMYVKV